jgi:hypothetical protein
VIFGVVAPWTANKNSGKINNHRIDGRKTLKFARNSQWRKQARSRIKTVARSVKANETARKTGKPGADNSERQLQSGDCVKRIKKWLAACGNSTPSFTQNG